MKVSELINILKECDPDIQVVVNKRKDHCYKIKSVKQIENFSLQDEDEWPYTVDICIG